MRTNDPSSVVTDYQALAGRVADMQSKISEPGTVQPGDVADLKQAVDAFVKDNRADSATASKLQGAMDDITKLSSAADQQAMPATNLSHDLGSMAEVLQQFAADPSNAGALDDHVSPGGASTKSDGNGGIESYAWLTVGDGTQNKTYVNFSPGSAADGSDSELYVNQGESAPAQIVGLNPAIRGPGGDGALFLPDGSLAVKANGAGYVVSNGVATNVTTGDKTSATDFFAANPTAVPTSDRAGFACTDGSGQPSTAQQASMESYGVTVSGYGANTLAMPSHVFDASANNSDGGRHWLGTGSASDGNAFVQYDTGSNELYASSSADPKSAIPLVGANPASQADTGSLFLPDGSVAFKYQGDGYLESQGTVVSITDPSKRQSASDFFAQNPGAKPTSATAGLTNSSQNGVPTAAQAAALSAYGVTIGGASSAPASSATGYQPEPTSKGTTNVPGGGVTVLDPSSSNYQELSKWPDVQSVVGANAGLAPQTGADPALTARDYGNTAKRADPTLDNEGWQAYSVPGAHTAVLYNPTPGVSAPLHAFDTNTGKEIALPPFLQQYGPSGSIVFSDGTRLDLKENGANNSGNNGLTFISGDQITTSDARVSPGASLSAPKQATDPGAVKAYLAGTRLNPFNTAVAASVSNGTQQFAFTNNETPGGAQAWGLAGDGSFGGQTQVSLSWLNDPNSTQNAAVTQALFPDTGYAPSASEVSAGWSDAQIGAPPVTEAQFHKQQALGAIGALTSFIPGIGEAVGLSAAATRGLQALAAAAGTSASKIVLVGEAGLRGAPLGEKGASLLQPPNYKTPPPKPQSD